ncbi:MAG: 3-dehydroquinate dehydratase, partial [Clostridia bacterium]|nr:3-dehydroquinate dehydratase [Clostridia bacterium]
MYLFQTTPPLKKRRRRYGGIFVKILVINGPNLNLLGVREPEIYGNRTLKDLENLITAHADKKGISVSFFQTNHEGK